MIGGSLARRYARADYIVGAGRGNQEILAKEVEDLAATFDASPDLREALVNPVFPREERERVLAAVLARMAASETTRNFARVLLDRERIDLLPAVAHELRVMVDDNAGRLRGEVVSARPLAPETVSRIQAALEQVTKKKVILSARHDPALIGGVVARVGDLVFDGSLKRQLQDVREQVLSE